MLGHGGGARWQRRGPEIRDALRDGVTGLDWKSLVRLEQLEPSGATCADCVVSAVVRLWSERGGGRGRERAQPTRTAHRGAETRAV